MLETPLHFINLMTNESDNASYYLRLREIEYSQEVGNQIFKPDFRHIYIQYVFEFISNMQSNIVSTFSTQYLSVFLKNHLC